MMNAPLPMPMSKPAKPAPEAQPNDLMAWLQEQLLGGKGQQELDPAISSLLSGLLGGTITNG